MRELRGKHNRELGDAVMEVVVKTNEEIINE